jgi:hypothetical protein
VNNFEPKTGTTRGRWGARRPVDFKVNGRALPHSVEAEEALLSCCLLDGAGVVALCGESRIGPESFYVAAHGVIFATLVAMAATQKPIDAGVLAEELKAAGQLEAVGGYAFIVQVSKREATTVQVAYYIARVRALELARQKARRAAGLLEELYKGDAEGVTREEAALKEIESESTGFLPAVVSAVEMGARKMAKPAELIGGVLHVGCMMVVAGGSKSFKTWVLLDQAIAIASGAAWWGFRTTAAKVLFVNFELPDWSLDDRIAEICTARKIARPADLEVWNLRGYATDIDELLPYFEARGVRGQYGLIILDPIYVCLGARDENSNSDVTQLMNRLLRLARVTGAAVAFGHHFSKGNQSEKDSKDRPAGAGAWVRAPDSVVTLTAHKEEEAFRVDFVLRNLKPRKEMVVKWSHPLMTEAAHLDPNALREPGRPKESTVDNIVSLLPGDGGGLTYGEWEKAAAKKGVSESTFKRRLNEAVEANVVTKNGPVYSRRKRDV